MNITGNVEFIWYIYAYLASIIFFGNENLFKLSSVLLPLILYYVALRKINKTHAIAIIFFLLLFQNQFIHLTFHVWRAFLAGAIFFIAVSNYVNGKKYLALLLLSILTHVSFAYVVLMFLISVYLENKGPKLTFCISIITPYLIFLSFILFILLCGFNAGDRSSYFDIGISEFRFQIFTILYLILTILMYNKLDCVVCKSMLLMIMSTASLPLLFPSYSVLIPRFIEISLGLFFLILLKSCLLNNKYKYFAFYLVSIVLYYRTYNDSQFVVKYLADGNPFTYLSGYIISFRHIH